jgi:hypothetical protein
VTVQFHVDNLKISHKEQSVLDNILNDLDVKFGTKKKALTASVYIMIILVSLSTMTKDIR